MSDVPLGLGGSQKHLGYVWDPGGRTTLISFARTSLMTRLRPSGLNTQQQLLHPISPHSCPSRSFLTIPDLQKNCVVGDSNPGLKLIRSEEMEGFNANHYTLRAIR
ncbi:hypothetical protein PGTUg99_017878 [Puccinia graminis f. sp. tritici]|uniref:Uncharacterized protein n=1 Tax=Puccinia graminis f. sp. tritici TaxID=56615 RepID=A0A5B0S408_PUCGR|nr:hypothetical protein PGTUg99_017878 [Puccinia graminis f. sp. tritici]